MVAVWRLRSFRHREAEWCRDYSPTHADREALADWVEDVQANGPPGTKEEVDAWEFVDRVPDTRTAVFFIPVEDAKNGRLIIVEEIVSF